MFKKVRFFVIAFYTTFIFKEFFCLRTLWNIIMTQYYLYVYGSSILYEENLFFFSIFGIIYITLHCIFHSVNSRKALCSWENVHFFYCTAINVATLFIAHTEIVEVDRSPWVGELSPFLYPGLENWSPNNKTMSNPQGCGKSRGMVTGGHEP